MFTKSIKVRFHVQTTFQLSCRLQKVEPLSGEDYDIDLGINLLKGTCKPLQVQEWVFEALNTGARTLEV